MNTDKDIAQLMDYLYGEMSPDEKKLFEVKLAKSPDLQSELDELRNTQHLLGKDHEVTPNEPLILHPITDNYKSKDQFWRRWAGVAASLLVVLLAAAWWNLSISVEAGAVTISFNKAEQEELLNEKVAFEESLKFQKSQLNEQLQTQVIALQDSLDQQFTLRKKQLIEVAAQQVVTVPSKSNTAYITKEELSILINALNQEQSNNAALLVNASAESQKEYMESLVTEFAAYMDAKRQSDLELINYALKEIQVQSNTKQEQTEIVLAKLLEKWEKE